MTLSCSTWASNEGINWRIECKNWWSQKLVLLWGEQIQGLQVLISFCWKKFKLFELIALESMLLKMPAYRLVYFTTNWWECVRELLELMLWKGKRGTRKWALLAQHSKGRNESASGKDLCIWISARQNRAVGVPDSIELSVVWFNRRLMF